MERFGAMTVSVRAVDLHDEKDAAELLRLLNGYARDPMGGGSPLSAFTRANLISRVKALNNFHAGLAWDESSGQAVGLINCIVGFSTFAAAPLLNVHDVVVESGSRGKGVGALLMAYAEKLAHDLRCCKLTLEVLSENHVAQRTYVRAGFRPYVLDPTAGHALLMVKSL